MKRTKRPIWKKCKFCGEKFDAGEFEFPQAMKYCGTQCYKDSMTRQYNRESMALSKGRK